MARKGAQMTTLGAEDSLPLGESIEQLLEDFLHLSGRTRVPLGAVRRPSGGLFDGGGVHVVELPRRRVAGRVDIRVEE